MSFVYSSLPTEESIRLLELQPQQNDTISFSLVTHELASAPPYDALSYTWDSPASQWLPQDHVVTDGKNIEGDCCGKSFSIRENLWSALKVLQSLDLSTFDRRRSRYLWIDAVCINQEDNSEKAVQVQMMGRIFETAQKVIAWLGPEDQTTNDVFTAIERLSSIPREKYNNCVIPEDLWMPESYISKLGISPLTQDHWLAWVTFFHRPYFQRVWIVQEIALAKEIFLVCGSRVFSWEQLSAAWQFVGYSGWAVLLHTEQMRYGNVLTKDLGVYQRMIESKSDFGVNAWNMIHTKNAVVESGKQWTLAHLLSRHRKCKCKDPRDMLYALIRLARKNHRPFDTQPQLLEVSYEISPQQLYTRTARSLLLAWGDLSLLSRREESSETRMPGLPSWVPDYSAELMPEPLASRAPNCKWRASGGSKWLPGSRELAPQVLDVQGIPIDDIKITVESLVDPSVGALQRYWASVCIIASGITIPYPADEYK